MNNVENPPRFRAKSYKMPSGEVHTYFLWDGRGRGRPDVRLGKDREQALKLWAECEAGIFPKKSAQKNTMRMLKVARPGARRKVSSEEWRASEAWVRTMYFNAERRATQAGRAFMLTPEDMLELVRVANGFCQISGIPFELTNEKSPFAPSLDRIDCAHGYRPGNVRLVCHVGNVAMNVWGLEPVLRFARAVNEAHAPTVSK